MNSIARPLFFILALVLALSACKPALTPENLYGKWKYIKLVNPNASPAIEEPEWKLKADDPSIIFTKNNELTIWWGGKILSHGTFKVEVPNILYKEILANGSTREFPFYVSEFNDNQMVFETMGTDGTRVTAVKQ